MSNDDLEDGRVVETVKAKVVEVVAKPLGVKDCGKVAHASEVDKDKALEDNVIGEVDESESVGDGDRLLKGS